LRWAGYGWLHCNAVRFRGVCVVRALFGSWVLLDLPGTQKKKNS
jgi:hypothetical protein